MKLATDPWAPRELAVREDSPLPPIDWAPAKRTSLLEQLYRDNSARLLRFFARRGARDEASDLVQETFARVAGLGHPTTDIAKPEAYLGVVATNLLRDRARQASRRAQEPFEMADDACAAGVDPHSILEDRDTLARLEAAIRRLNPRRRRIFLLHRLEHLTYAQIAVEMGMSVKGVKTQMAKALFELRRDAGSL